MQESAALNSSIDAATRFLRDSQDDQGRWMDFHLYPGISDEWVTGYAGCAASVVANEQCAGMAQSAWRFLSRRQRGDGRWGYNLLTIGDGDSTAWGLRLAHEIGNGNSDQIERARGALAEHLRENGGVATYATEGPIRRLIEAPEEQSFQGWCGAHTCVTAVVAGTPHYRDQTHSYLCRAQREDGSWRAYWWCDHEYATAFAAEALAKSGIADHSARIERAAEWAINRFRASGFIATNDHPAGSPFATALGLRAVLLSPGVSAGVMRTVQAAVAWLFVRQLPDGSWASSARLRVPWPHDDRPDEYTEWIYGGRKEGSLIVDRNRIFTTATILTALQRVKDFRM
jgi:squalene cyclase